LTRTSGEKKGGCRGRDGSHTNLLVNDAGQGKIQLKKKWDKGGLRRVTRTGYRLCENLKKNALAGQHKGKHGMKGGVQTS